MKKIAFAGTDGRTLLWALTLATAKSENYKEQFSGLVVRGTPAMPEFVRRMNWPVEFIPSESNSTEHYAQAITEGMRTGQIDYVVPMPETLLFEGIVDMLEHSGMGDRILGLAGSGAFVEGDKIRSRQMCEQANVPVASSWESADARDYKSVLGICLDFIHNFGGAVLKFPYSAGGKGSRIILNSWEIREVYDTLLKDYKDDYKKMFGTRNKWPLLIESMMSGVEISFTILVDKNGSYQILPTAMDYPERFEGPATRENPITGGTGAVSPHPMETDELLELAGKTIAEPIIKILKQREILRPCILYPGCFVSFDAFKRPTRIRVCEINIRPGEPEAQPVARRVRNLGALIQATLEGNLNEVKPEVRADQLSICYALMTGPGGPDGQKGYPWSCTKAEPVEIDFNYMKRKGVQVIPSAMTFSEKKNIFKSDGTRVAYLNGNITVKPDESRGEVADRLCHKILTAFDNNRIRVVPRENSKGNRLDLRRDIGTHYMKAEKIFS